MESKAGSGNGNARLTAKQIAEIRRMRKRGGTGIAIAAAYQITPGHVTRICNGERWAR